MFVIYGDVSIGNRSFTHRYKLVPITENSRFTNNVVTTAQGQGGAIFSLSSTLNVAHSLFLLNSASRGGAVAASRGTLSVVDCTASLNRADQGGVFFLTKVVALSTQ